MELRVSANDESLQVYAVAAPVRQQVINALFSAITSGRFKPGQRLVEKELCDLMGVSRPSVREALRHLESEGLIETIPNRGPVVSSFGPSDIVAIYQIRGALEALAAKLMAEHASDAQVQALEEAYDELAITMSSLDVSKTLLAKDRFYAALLQGAGNPMIGNVLRSMNARVTMLRRVSLSSPDRAPQSLRELKAVVEAIKRRDVEAAHRASWDHIENASRKALASMAKQGLQNAA
jgi:DNA-binding GntR family transcriptional regulator